MRAFDVIDIHPRGEEVAKPVKFKKAKRLLEEPLNFFEREARIEIYDFVLEADIRTAHLKLQVGSELAKLDPDDPYDVLEFLDDTLFKEGETFSQYRNRDSFTPYEICAGEGGYEGPLVKGVCFGAAGHGPVRHGMIAYHLPPQEMARQLKQNKSEE